LGLVFAGIAQLVERNLAKVEVASSSLVSRSSFMKREALLPFFSAQSPQLPPHHGRCTGAFTEFLPAKRRGEPATIAGGLDGEIGRHSGLKIRRL